MSYLDELFSLQGKTAVVIGGTGELCGTMAVSLAKAGAEVVLVGRDKEKAAMRLSQISDAGSKGYFIAPVLLRADAPREARAVHEHEVFGPVSTLMPYESADEVVALVALGEGGLVSSVYSNDRDFLSTAILGLAPFSGRVLVGSKKVADQAIAPGMVLPSCVHGGPGRAGGGEELGGERGLAFYTQRTAIQGDRALLDRIL